jgi:putative redox protein
MSSEHIDFQGPNGQKLAGILELPSAQSPHALALFAHCFSCSKDIAASRSIARELARQGIGVLRFDFTGLGQSEGDFSDTNFSTNLQDLEAAAIWLNENYGGPDLLVGHSLGGAAVIAVAGSLESVKAVATIGAPSDTGHVVHNFGAKLDEIQTEGKAEVLLAGRPFTIKKQFVDDVTEANVLDAAASLGLPLLIMHAPTDQTVGIENASKLFVTAKHPKSFVSLDTADHLLSRASDAIYAADVIANWAARYLPNESPGAKVAHTGGVHVAETQGGLYQNRVSIGRHRYLADEPVSVGGGDTGPGPYEYVGAGLGACTSMTLRMYANRKKWPLDSVAVTVNFSREQNPADPDGERIDTFLRLITIEGDLDETQRERLLEIADKCPVHRTLERKVAVKTQFA